MAHSSAQTNNGGNNMNNTATIISGSSSNATNIINNNNSSKNTTTANNSNNVVQQQRHASQPIDITASSTNGAFVKPSAPTVAQQLAFNKMDKKKTNRRFDKNLTFSTPVDDPVMDEDFDFEKNLALFDKQAIWDKIDANQKPDLVSLLHKLFLCHIHTHTNQLENQ